MALDETTPAGSKRKLDTQATTPALGGATPGRSKDEVDPHGETSPVGGATPSPLDEHVPTLPSERYVYEGHLGSGGMGAVYRVRDLSLGREVALKKLHATGFTDPERQRRFERETRAAATLDHPHIVRVIDVGVLPDGCPYYTMDLLEGMDLATAVRAQKISITQAVEAIRQVADALQYAHQRGILHRDIKPGNVYLKSWPPPRPTAKVLQRFADSAVKHVHALLLDFGLAKFVEHDLSGGEDTKERPTSLQTMTQSGQLIGTPSYMAPEQANATRELDARVDVYGLGATLYHAVTGRPPFIASSLLELIDMLGTKEPLSPKAINPEVNRDLETLILRCLQKKPEDRYPSAEDLSEDCRRWLGGDSIAARPIGPAGRVWRRIRRAPVATAIIVALLGMGGYEHHRASDAARDAEVATRRSRVALSTALRDVFDALLVLRRSGEATKCVALAERIDDLAGQAVAVDERMPEPWFYRGRVQRMAGRLDDAEASLGRAISLASGPAATASGRELLPLALYERGVLRAVRCLVALVDGGAKAPPLPLDPSAHPEAARLARLAADDLSSPAWIEAEKDGTTSHEARLGVSWGVLALLEGKGEGPTYLQRAIGQDASLEDAYALLGRVAEVGGGWEEAAGWYEKGVAAVRGSSTLLRDRARALTRHAEALERQGKDPSEPRRQAEAALETAEAMERPAGE